MQKFVVVTRYGSQKVQARLVETDDPSAILSLCQDGPDLYIGFSGISETLLKREVYSFESAKVLLDELTRVMK